MAKLHSPSWIARTLFRDRQWIPRIRRHNLDWTLRISRSLHVRKRARIDAQRLQPDRDDTELNLTQKQIVNRCEEGAKSLYAELSNRLDLGQHLILERMPRTMDVKVIENTTRKDVLSAWAEKEPDAVQTRQRQQARLGDLKEFQEENDLAADAVYRHPPVIAALAILAALSVETYLNAGLFAKSSPNYWSGGLLQAFLFSVINIVLGFGGLGLVSARFTQHKSRFKQAVGWLGAAVTGLAGIGWNLFIGHFRELAAVGRNAAGPWSSKGYFNTFGHMKKTR